jgi:putative drug exporter of the RND superfamily
MHPYGSRDSDVANTTVPEGQLTTRTAADPPHVGLLSRLSGACARHGWRTVIAWIVAVVAIAGAASAFGGTLVDEFSIPNSDAQRATDLLKERFPARAGDSLQVVFATDSGTLRSPEARRGVQAVLAQARDSPEVRIVGSPYGAGGALGADGTIGYADVQYAVKASDVEVDHITDLERRARAAAEPAGLQVQFGGPVAARAEQSGTSTSELVGLVVAVIVLVIALGSIAAMLLPVGTALLAVGLGMLLITLGAALTSLNTITPTLATMIGLGVGIDYALFIVTRFRQALHDGMPAPRAAAHAASTAGRAVVFAGVTVAVAIGGLLIIGLPFITYMGLGAALTVLIAVLLAVTLLPAVLSLLGHRIDRWRPPLVRRHDASEASRRASWAARWAAFVVRRPWRTGGVATLILLALATPILTLQLGSSDAGSNPASSTTRRAYDLLSEGFGPGFNGPLVIAVAQGRDTGAAAELAAALRTTPGVAAVPAPAVNADGSAAVVTAIPTTSPQSAATADLVHRLRGDVVPTALRGTGASAYVGGQTAAFEDIASQMSSRLGWFLLVVVGIIFTLITMSFRSVVVALKAVLTTALSTAAAFGILVAVFQHGWGAGALGVDRTGPIESFLPAIMFAIVFGLATDYEVFLMSRIREEHAAGRSAQEAILEGMAGVGRVVVAAALIMGAVFLSFMLGGERTIMEFGLALGSAILIDAFITRLTIVPALLRVLGERAWYMPRRLDRILPRLTIEPPAAAPAPAQAPGRLTPEAERG